MVANESAGVRVNAVQQGVVPPYAYSVGLASRSGYDLICAGALRYRVDQIGAIIQACASQLARTRGAATSEILTVIGLGEFSLGSVHGDWLSGLIPAEYQNRSAGTWYQLIPTFPARTVDVPDLAISPSEGRDPVWQWLTRAWDLDIPKGGHLVTTLDVLSGTAPITVFRWEADQWEALERPAVEVDHADARVAPISVLSAVVADWTPFLRLPVGQGLRRISGNWIPA